MGEFDGAGKAVGLETWRIEKMVPVKQDDAMCDGKLFSGDSYIVLSTTLKGSALVWHIHFWLGEETSQDESGVAAYKTVALDEALGGGPVQHRECQGHESELFMSYFKKTGLEYLPGGMESGFHKVERDVWRPRLLQCKGKRTVRATEKPCNAASLNKGDVFVLDLGLELFLYNGANANKYEKAKGAEMVRKIHDERGARGTVAIVNEDPENASFWGALGGLVEVTAEGDDDEAASKASAAEVKLLHLSDAGGNVSMAEQPRNAKGQLTRDMLSGDDAYILDCGDSIFVWTGKKASKTEKKESMLIAAQFVADQGRPAHTPIERVCETGESAMFKSFFFQFDPVRTPAQMWNAPPSPVAAAVADTPVDVAALQAKAQEETPVDDGSGELTIWRIEDFKKVEVPHAQHGQFYGGDSYMVLYAYQDPRGKAAWLLYVWQGKASSADEKGAAALLANELDNAMGGAPVQVRVVQGKEPLHFRSLFKGALLVHAGGKASGFKNRADADTYDDDGVSLFHVKGATPADVVGVQCAEQAMSLNSMDCFVLVAPAAVYSWQGRGASGAEKDAGVKIAELLKGHSFKAGELAPERSLVVVAEGAEPDEFWAPLGGKGEYASQPPDEPLPSEPRLFSCSDKFGSFAVEEISSFGQDDMLDDDVYMLDCGTAVYLWVGAGASLKEKDKSLGVAAQYVVSCSDGRDPDCPILQVTCGAEPLLFTQFFPAWDHGYFASRGEPGAGLLDGIPSKAAAAAATTPVKISAAAVIAKQASPAAMRYAAAAAGGAAAAPGGGGGADYTSGGAFLDPATTSFSYDELSGPGVPQDANPAAKEQYLADAEFLATFGVDKAAFNAQAAWKRKAAKEKKKLF